MQIPVFQESLHFKDLTGLLPSQCRGQCTGPLSLTALAAANTSLRKLPIKSGLRDLFWKHWSLYIPIPIANPKWFRVLECSFVYQPWFLGCRWLGTLSTDRFIGKDNTVSDENAFWM
jgi:hypothetical protein